jgi:hypothetical protein
VRRSWVRCRAVRFAALVVLSAVALAPGRGAAAVPTAQAPIVVAGVPVTLDQARARAGSKADADVVATALTALAHARWVAGEAARRRVRGNPARVAGVLAREQRAAGGVAQWQRFLAERGIPETEARARIEEQVLREALVDAITASARGHARRWGAAMDAFNERWRAVTACAPDVAERDVCGNLKRTKERCDWYALGDGGFFPLGQLCRVPSEWFVNLDLIEQFYPRSDPTELACVPHGDAAVARLRRYLRRTAPLVAHGVFFDDDCDPQLITAPSRSALVTALHGVAHIAASERHA